MKRNPRIWLLVSSIVLAGCAAVPRPPSTRCPMWICSVSWRLVCDWRTFRSFSKRTPTTRSSRTGSNADGTIATTFTFRKGSFDGERKRHQPRGFVFDTQTNAVWGMQFIWPFKGDFRIVYLNSDYTVTVIGERSATMSGSWPPAGDSGIRIRAHRGVIGPRGLRHDTDPEGATTLGAHEPRRMTVNRSAELYQATKRPTLS